MLQTLERRRKYIGVILSDEHTPWDPGPGALHPGPGTYRRGPGPRIFIGTGDLEPLPGTRDQGPYCGTLFKGQIRGIKVRKPILFIRASE